MSLDQNLFTLILTPNKDHSNVVDLVDPSGITHYRKQRLLGRQDYKSEVYDPMSESLLATASAPSATSKAKTLELYNPTTVVELRYTGTLSFRWAFKWEEHEFEWKREECFLLRKPDPPVLVAVTKEPSGRLRTSSVQILDYNLNRFDINDRKGLEIVILTALLTFQDSNEAHHARGESLSPPTMSRATTASSAPAVLEAPPVLPPQPALKTGVDRIAEMQTAREGGEYNEILVEAEGSVHDYGQFCAKLLQDDMLFITVKSAEAEQVAKVLQVVEETKRIRHKAGLSEDQELHQYVLYDTLPLKKGPRRINLDDSDKSKSKYTPPNSLSVHLSKIPMPELQPKATSGIADKSSKKKEEKKAPVPVTVSATPPTPAPSSSKDKSSLKDKYIKLTRPTRSSSPKRPSSTQPPPTPSQLDNPMVYTPPSLSRQPSPSPSSQSTPSFPMPSSSYGSNNSWSAPHAGGLSPYGAPAQSSYAPYYPSSVAAPAPHWNSHPPPSPYPPASLNMPTASKPVLSSNVKTGLFDTLLHRR